MELRLWLVTSTCAGYDDDAQISCEHEGEGGQRMFPYKYVAIFQLITAEAHENMDDWWWWWLLPLLLLFIFVCVLHSSFFSFPIFTWFIICQRQPKECWRGKKERVVSRGL